MGSSPAEYPNILELNWINEQFLIKQRERVDLLTRSKLGRQLSTGARNLALLQRVIDEELIESTNTIELQALGVIMGDSLIAQEKNLLWYVYEDELGKSLAVCVKHTEHCLFPITMLSRRMEVGVKPKVERIFNKGLDAIKPHLPRLPFSRH